MPKGVELVEEIVSKDVAAPPKNTLVGFSETERPGGLVADNTTVPVNPLKGAMRIVDVPVCPAIMVMLFGRAVMPRH